MKTKDKQTTDVVTRKPIEHIVFSLKYITSNNHYGAKSSNDVTLREFLEKMGELSHCHLSEVRMLGKIRGSEAIRLSQFKPHAKTMLKNISIIDPNGKLDVIRFGEQKYRIICKSDPTYANILHIVAFDWDFSLYDH